MAWQRLSPSDTGFSVHRTEETSGADLSRSLAVNGRSKG